MLWLCQIRLKPLNFWRLSLTLIFRPLPIQIHLIGLTEFRVRILMLSRPNDFTIRRRKGRIIEVKANLCSFRHSIGDAPWIVLGDFNVVRSTGEIDGGSNLRSNVGKKLRLVKVELKKLNCTPSLHVSLTVKNSKATNDCCQVSLASMHTNLSLAELEKTLLKNYSSSLIMDESFVKRKSRV
ncbi:hypothetical protein ACFX15_027115 [Malus domestica]